MTRVRSKTRTPRELPPAISSNPLGSHGLQRMSDELIHQTQKPDHVRCPRVRVEGRLVDPFRVKVIDRRITYRLVEMDSHAPRLSAGRSEKPHELVTQLRLLS